MKKRAFQILSIIIATSVLTLSVAPYSKAGSANLAPKTNDSDDDIKTSVTTIFKTNSSDGEKMKNETVYVFTDANGSVNKITVSDWLKNTKYENSLKDVSTLTDIENVKGDETFVSGANNEKTWMANGNDIYYQGTTDKPLPVDMKITYYLNDKQVDAKEIKGKNGKVRIRFDFTNNEYEVKTIGDEEVKIYVPFTVVSGMILQNDNFRNIEVTNGRVVNDGDKSIVVATAFPGLAEDLNIDAEDFEIPSYYEITADVTDFTMDSTMTLVTNEFFNDINFDALDDMDDMSAVDELTDAMDKLMNGSDEMYDGMCKLLKSCNDLSDGMNTLTDGSLKVKNGASDLDNGVSSLQSGANDLQNGLNTLKSNNDALNDGAKQVFDTLLNEANKQLKENGIQAETLTIDNYAEVLTSIIESLDQDNVYSQAREQVAAKVDSMGDSLYKTYIDTIENDVYDAYLASIGEDIYKKYIYSNANDIYKKYVYSISDDICMKYLSGNADSVIDQYIQNNSDDIIDKYLSSQSEDIIKKYIYDNSEAIIANAILANYMEANGITELTEEQKAQILGNANLTDEEKNQILEGAVNSISDDQKAQILEGAKAALTDDQKAQIIAGAKASLTDEQKAQILEGALAQISEEQKAQILEGAIAALTDEQKTQILEGAIASLTDDQKALILAGAKEQLTDEQKAQIKAGALAKLTDEQKAAIREGAINKGMQSDEVAAALESANEGVKKLSDLKGQLDSYNEFYQGLQAYTAGVAKAADGAGALKTGTDKVKNGTGELAKGTNDLYNGCKTINDKMPELIDGVTKLTDGSKEMKDGIQKFNDEGISKLTDILKNDLEGTIDRLKATGEVSEDYTNYSGKSEDMSGLVKFIYKTDSL